MSKNDAALAKAYHDAVKQARDEIVKLTENGTRQVKIGVYNADLNNRLTEMLVHTISIARVAEPKENPLNELITLDDGTDVNHYRKIDARRRLEEVAKDEYDAYLLIDWRGNAPAPALEVKVGRLGDRPFVGVLSLPPQTVLDRPLITLTIVVPQKVATLPVHLDMLFELEEADFTDPFGKTPFVHETNLRILRDRGEDI